MLKSRGHPLTGASRVFGIAFMRKVRIAARTPESTYLSSVEKKSYPFRWPTVKAA